MQAIKWRMHISIHRLKVFGFFYPAKSMTQTMFLTAVIMKPNLTYLLYSRFQKEGMIRNMLITFPVVKMASRMNYGVEIGLISTLT